MQVFTVFQFLGVIFFPFKMLPYGSQMGEPAWLFTQITSNIHWRKRQCMGHPLLCWINLCRQRSTFPHEEVMTVLKQRNAISSLFYWPKHKVKSATFAKVLLGGRMRSTLLSSAGVDYFLFLWCTAVFCLLV